MYLCRRFYGNVAWFTKKESFLVTSFELFSSIPTNQPANSCLGNNRDSKLSYCSATNSIFYYFKIQIAVNSLVDFFAIIPHQYNHSPKSISKQQDKQYNMSSSSSNSTYYSRKFIVVLLASILQSGTIDAYFPTVPKTAFRHVSVSSSVSPSPLVLSSTSTTTDFSTFANSLESDIEDENDNEETMRGSASTSSEKPWQAKLDDLLDPSTNLADRQILLSELLTSNDKIRDDVLDALTNRKVRDRKANVLATGDFLLLLDSIELDWIFFNCLLTFCFKHFFSWCTKRLTRS